jgi:presenilin-like A22 family membrane protease
MKSILFIIIIFLAIQFLGLYIGSNYIGAIRSNIAESPEVIPGMSSENPEISFLLFGYMMVVTAVMLFVIKIKKGFIRGLEALVVFFSSWTTFLFLIPFAIQDAWLAMLSPAISLFGGFSEILVFLLGINSLLAFALTVWKVFRPSIISQNVAALFTGSGVGALMGLSFGIVPSIIFMMILSVYDFVSVFITKHMVTMAKAVTERPMAFTIAAPHEFKKAKYVPLKGTKKKVHVFQLGMGDVIIPLMFSVSILNRFSILHSLFSIAGSAVALLVLSVIITRKPMALPALPFVCAGSLAGYLLSLAAFGF